MKIVSVRENPAYLEKMVDYISSKWSAPRRVYEDCIAHCIHTKSPLPQWYVLEHQGRLIGCAGLITNDFISRMDLYPWIGALFIEEEYRGNSYGHLLLQKAEADAGNAGFRRLYLSTDHIGYYEKYGYRYIGDGYHPWDESSRIYEKEL